MQNNKFIGYVGTYTKEGSQGVYQFTLDTQSEKITDVKLAAKLENPTYVNVSANKKYLYAVAKEGSQGGVASYAINHETGKLSKLNQELSDGANPCHVSTDSKTTQLVTANYHKGTIESHLINEDGTISPTVSVMAHSGSGPHERQEKPHAHYSGFTPDEKFVVGVDLGTDEIVSYRIENGTLTKVASYSTNSGSGPRHLTFHPNGKYAYVMTELSSEVIVLSYDMEKGRFTEKQYISTIPETFTANNQGSAVHISSDGKFVYAGNRGHNSIAVFSVNQDTGGLTLVEIVSSEGDWPRDFVLDPTEAFVVGSNETTGNLVLYARNQSTGKLSVIQSDVKIPKAVCIKFL
ncbi:lactonase family protein [Bacillus solitudinis]|uniref:lactonase family protein n=1 Tax=Bacillus solitudinis TaxID=2014074 RepID=UPI000C240A76|nr:lactonase family protein [Bacillus solitudinis]